MHLIPGLVMLVAVSGALYKTREIWPKDEYDANHDGKKAKGGQGGYYAPGAGIQSGVPGGQGSSHFQVPGFGAPDFRQSGAMGGSQLR